LPAALRRAARAGLPALLATRVALLLLALAGAWTVLHAPVGDLSAYLARWQRWDAVLFARLAAFGYGGDPSLPHDPGLPSFFPGYPLLLRAVAPVVGDPATAGLLLSLVGGAVAAVALAALVLREGGTDLAARRAVLYLFAAPFAVFLVAGYSEPVFLALALPAWLAARERRWALAGLLAGGAALVRVSGLFLAVALLVEYAVHERRPRASALALLAPFVTAGGYVVYLHSRTGDWLAWPHAQAAGFGRRFAWPWDALSTTLSAARDAGQGSEYRWSFGTEIACVALGVVLVLVLLRRRRWGEAVYVGTSLAALACSTFFFSVSRALLLWWPLFVLLARAADRRPWVHGAYLAVALPLLAALTLTFTAGFWTG
jgi:hypothetical protein